MRWWLNLISLGLVATVGLGCGKSSGPDAQAGAGTQAGTADDDSPDKAVHGFLSAAQAGDQKRLTSLLTQAAQAEAAKNGVNFELDSYQNASFQLEQFEYLSEAKDSAHVSCKWTDRYADGTEETHDVIWVLRHEAAGWRVAGMIIRPFPDKPPVALNYEDMKALAEAKDFIEQESQRREKAQQQQPTAGQPLTAQQPPGPQQGAATTIPGALPPYSQQPSGVQQTGLQQASPQPGLQPTALQSLGPQQPGAQPLGQQQHVGPGPAIQPEQTAQKPAPNTLPPK